MVFYLPESVETATTLDELTPRQIVAELDKYVVGQNRAKRCVAVAADRQVSPAAHGQNRGVSNGQRLLHSPSIVPL